MSFNIWFVRSEKKLLNKIEEINQELEDRIPVLTEDHIRFQSLRRLTEQEKCLQTILPSVREDMESFRSAILTALEQNSVSVGESMKEALEGVKELVRRMNDDQAQLVTDSLKTIIEQMEANLTNVFEKMSGSFEHSSKAVRESVEMLDIVIAKLKSEIDAAGEAAKTQIQTIADDTSQISHRLLETLEKGVAEMNRSIEAAGEKAAKHMEALSEQITSIENAVRTGSEEVRKNIVDMEEASNRTKEIFVGLASHVEEVSRSLADVVKSLEEEGAQFEHTVSSLRTTLSVMSETANDIRQGKDSTDETLRTAIAEVQSVMTEATDALSEELKGMQRMLGDLSEQQAGLTERARELNEVMEKSVESLAVALERIQGSLASNLSAADDKLATAVRTMADGFGDSLEAQKHAVENLRQTAEILSRRLEKSKQGEKSEVKTQQNTAVGRE